MTISLALTIAVRHLSARRGQTVRAILGVALSGGISALMLAGVKGQSQLLRESLLESSPHITVRSSRDGPTAMRSLVVPQKGGILELRTNAKMAGRDELKPYDAVMTHLESLAPDVTAVAPFVSFQAGLRNGPLSTTAEIRGVILPRERRAEGWVRTVRDGDPGVLEHMPSGIVIGSGLARMLQANVGSKLSLVAPNGRVKPVTVVALFESEVSGLDDGRAYVNLAFAQSVRGMQRNAVTGISVRTSEINRVHGVCERVQKTTGLAAETWDVSNAQQVSIQSRLNATVELLVALVVVIGAFGVANMLNALVLHKQRDFAIMRVYGLSRAGLILMLLCEGTLIGLVGGILGSVTGYVVASALGSMNLISTSEFRTVLGGDRFPMSLDLWIYVATVALSASMSLAAGALPAIRAARCNAADVIRGER